MPSAIDNRSPVNTSLATDLINTNITATSFLSSIINSVSVTSPLKYSREPFCPSLAFIYFSAINRYPSNWALGTPLSEKNLALPYTSV